MKKEFMTVGGWSHGAKFASCSSSEEDKDVLLVAASGRLFGSDREQPCHSCYCVSGNIWEQMRVSLYQQAKGKELWTCHNDQSKIDSGPSWYGQRDKTQCQRSCFGQYQMPYLLLCHSERIISHSSWQVYPSVMRLTSTTLLEVKHLGQANLILSRQKLRLSQPGKNTRTALTGL